MPKQEFYFSLQTIENLIHDILVKIGVPEQDAKVCSEVLIASDRRGIESHGIARTKAFYYDRIKDGTLKPVTKMEVVKDSPTTAVIDGHDGMGHVIGKRAMQMAIDKAKKFGMGMVAVRNSNHYGIAGYYAQMAVEQGMIGITGTNARPAVAPTFGVENLFGTNPLTFGIPSDDPFPFIFDGSTSLVQRGKIEVYARKGKKIPDGWVIDRDGNYLSDPAAVLDGLMKGTAALTPLGGVGEENSGYKGYGFAMVVEILCSALQSGAFLRALSGVANGQKTFCHIGHFFMAVDISTFLELSEFRKHVGDMLREVRASKKAKGQDRIYTAGEKEYLISLEREAKGVPLTRQTIEEVRTMIKETNLSGYDFNIK